jgi:hypothetical protein
MEPIKAILCSECEHCSNVEMTDRGVTIGEDANTVQLSHTEGNEPVRLGESGTLREV